MPKRIHYEDNEEIISDINIVPLVDISLVLLIIIMVTANYMAMSFIKVEIPKAAHSITEEKDKNDVNVTMTADGPIYLEDKIVTAKELKEQMAMRRKKNQNLAVILNIDKRVRFKEIVDVIDLLSEVNVTNLNFTVIKD